MYEIAKRRRFFQKTNSRRANICIMLIFFFWPVLQTLYIVLVISFRPNDSRRFISNLMFYNTNFRDSLTNKTDFFFFSFIFSLRSFLVFKTELFCIVDYYARSFAYTINSEFLLLDLQIRLFFLVLYILSLDRW